MSTSTLSALLQTSLDTLATLRVQLTNLQAAILAPPTPLTPPSPDNTLLVPSHTPNSPTLITDSSHNNWTLAPNGPSSTPTLFLNGYPDPFTAPASLALYLNSTLYFQRITGQWYLWSTTPSGSHWLPTSDPSTPSSPQWSTPPATRATDGLTFSWLPEALRASPLSSPLSINYDLLTDLFTDTNHRASTFLPSPIPLITRPRGVLPSPLIFQRSDNTFLLPLFGPTTPITFQFPGLRPTFIRLWSGLRPPRGPSNQSPSSTLPVRVATGTDTIAVPFTRDSFFIIELSLG